MTTIHRVQLDREAHAACALLAQAQYQLLVIRERQLAEADRECEGFREDAMNAERNAEATWERIDTLCTQHGLGEHGSALEKLSRISGLLELYSAQYKQVIDARDEAQARLVELGAQVADAKARGFWPPAERPEVPVFAELGFEAPEWATMFQASMRAQGQPVTPDHELLRGWFANAIMRGYDEHARKYSKLIELAVMGDRTQGGAVYTSNAEQEIAKEAERFVDPGAPPEGWLPVEKRHES